MAVKGFKILARHHNWVAGATITESCNVDDTIRRFTATIRGWRNFLIYEGKIDKYTAGYVIAKVRGVRDSIDEGDDSIFYQSVQLGR